jgi:fatty-acyl-CoA synthase
MNSPALFDLSSVFSTVADAVPDQDMMVWLNETRWSVSGDRARILPDGRIELLGRDSVTINSGGEKIYLEEVERAVAAYRAITDAELIHTCRGKIADYKIPKAFIRTPMIVRSHAGKADYRSAAALAAAQI